MLLGQILKPKTHATGSEKIQIGLHRDTSDRDNISPDTGTIEAEAASSTQVSEATTPAPASRETQPSQAAPEDEAVTGSENETARAVKHQNDTKEHAVADSEDGGTEAVKVKEAPKAALTAKSACSRKACIFAPRN